MDLTVYGELRIDKDVSLDDFKSVIYNLRVDSDIQAPRHLIGFLYAKSKCYGEIEEIEDFNIDTDENGFNYGIGVEVAVNHKYKVISEYEHAVIDGPRGDSLFVGVMYNF